MTSKSVDITYTSSMDIREPYRSLPLLPGSKCIRVFDVYPPATSGDGGPLRGMLRIANLEDESKQPFAALSYVWGQYATQRHKISYGSGNFEVTVNCHAAILHLRRSLGGFSIWIDAICINQGDDMEKGGQIALMELIFATANTVYIWLGEASPESDRAMDYLATAGLLEYFFDGVETSTKQMQVKPRKWAAVWYIYVGSWSLGMSRVLRDRPNLIRRWLLWMHIIPTSQAHDISSSDLNTVLNCEWMGRIWTFQEILLASNPIVVRGSKHLPWSRLAFSVIFLDHLRAQWDLLEHELSTASWMGLLFSKSHLEGSRPGVIPSFIEPFSNLASVGTGVYTEYHNFLQSLTATYRDLEICEFLFDLLVLGSLPIGLAFLAVNSLYGLILLLPTLICLWRGLSGPFYVIKKRGVPLMLARSVDDTIVRELCVRKATDSKDKSFALFAIFHRLRSSPNVPDYSKPESQLYLELSVQILQVTNSLQLLLPAAMTGQPEGPSWAPDWNKDFQNAWLNPSFMFDRSRNNATRSSTPKWSLSTENRLTVRGYRKWEIRACCGTITKTSDTYNDEERPIHEDNLRALFKLIRAFIREQGLHIQGDWREQQAWVRSAYEESVFDPHPERPNNHHRAGTRNDSLWYSWIKTLLRRCSDSPSKVLTSIRGDRHTLKRHIAVCNDLAKGEKTFVLAGPSEPTLGVCAATVQVGDKVLLVSGVSLPLISRMQSDSSHRLVSPCRLVGTMNGNIWRSLSHEKGPEEIVIS